MPKLVAFASVIALVGGMVAGCSRGVPPAELPTPTATGITSPYPTAYAWVRANLEGQLKGEFLVGDPQDSYERVRGRVEGEELEVEIGFASRGLRFRTPPLRGGSRYILRKGEGELSIVIDGTEWSTEAGGVCSVIFSYVRGPQIPFTVPEGYRIYEADAGFVCAAMQVSKQSRSSIYSPSPSGSPGAGLPGRGQERNGQSSEVDRTVTPSESSLSISEGFLHFFFVVPPREGGSAEREPRSSQRTNTPTAAPTG